MLTRIMIIAMLLATACAPTPLQSAPARAPAGAAEKDTSEITVTPSPAKEKDASRATAIPSPAKGKDASESTAVPSPVMEDALQKKSTQIVIKDLASRLSIDTEAISVLSTEAIVWPNAALGCPLPGKDYAQGKVSGFRIRLAAQNKEYSYHTDRTGQFVLCPKENPEIQERPSIPITPGEIDDGQPWVPVN
jgi:hypothetical protein